MGFMKGKLELRLFDKFKDMSKRYWGKHMW